MNARNLSVIHSFCSLAARIVTRRYLCMLCDARRLYGPVHVFPHNEPLRTQSVFTLQTKQMAEFIKNASVKFWPDARRYYSVMRWHVTMWRTSHVTYLRELNVNVNPPYLDPGEWRQNLDFYIVLHGNVVVHMRHTMRQFALVHTRHCKRHLRLSDVWRKRKCGMPQVQAWIYSGLAVCMRASAFHFKQVSIIICPSDKKEACYSTQNSMYMIQISKQKLMTAELRTDTNFHLSLQCFSSFFSFLFPNDYYNIFYIRCPRLDFPSHSVRDFIQQLQLHMDYVSSS